MIDIAPRLCDVGPKGPKGRSMAFGQAAKRKLYAEAGAGAPTCKRRRSGPALATTVGTTTPISGHGARFVDLQIVGEDGALVEEATIEEIWAPHATRLEIVVVDDAWDSTATDSAPTSLDGESAYIDLDDPVLGPLGPLGGTSTLHSAILREARQHAPAPASAAAQVPASSYAPRPHADQADSDFGNLDWLINFKVDSVFEPKKKHKSKTGGAVAPVTTSAPGVVDQACDPLPAAASPGALSPGTPVGANARAGTGTATTAGRSASPKAAAASPAPAPAAAAPSVPALTANPSPHPQAHRYSGPGKPPFTYTELIELALKDKGKLTVKEIYQWITKHFPFYQASDERWKNSVRHNLSINPHFRKESKAPQGAGHLWVVMDNNNKAKNSWKEERIQNFLAAQVSAAEAAESAASAAAAAAPEPSAAPIAACVASPPSPVRPPTPPSPVTTGAKSYSQLNTWWSERVSLERSAEEILSGVKREVGVEFLTPMDLDGDLDTDVMKLDMKDEKGFLYGDLTTEQVLAESGLQDELAGLYLLNDMTSPITGDSLFPDDLNFAGLELPLSG